MQEFTKGRYRVRLAAGAADVTAAQRLRHRAFRGGEGVDADRFDAYCRHVMVEDGGRLLATCRIQRTHGAEGLAQSYSAQFYDLNGFLTIGGPFLEIGRFCVAPDVPEAADVLRLIWAALTRIVDGEGVAVMFGCSSFPGCNPAAHAGALSLLASRHLGPPQVRPVARAGEVWRLRATDGAALPAGIPPLLRTYLLMGGWVGEDAVIDRDLDTLHVFTAVRIADIPPARARLLRQDAA